MSKAFYVVTSSRDEFIDITSDVQRMVTEANVQNGTCTVYVPHTTAGITVNENADPDVQHDMLLVLNELIQWKHPQFRHGEGNSAAHVKASLMGSSVQVIISRGRLQLGQWQGLYLCEFDGPRRREVWVTC